MGKVIRRILEQPRTPVCTGISVVVSFVVWVVILLIPTIPTGGWDALAYFFGALATLVAGLLANIILGNFALSRGEYLGGRIAAMGIALWILTGGALFGIHTYRQNQKERARIWGPDGRTVRDAFVQPDGKIVIVGAGLVRLLKDGQPDPSYRRDYTFAHRGRLPSAAVFGEACVAMSPRGDLILANAGWIGHVLPDGRDAPDLFRDPLSKAKCWGLAVPNQGGILIDWILTPSGNRFSRLLPQGGIDLAFEPTTVPWSHSGRIAIQNDGKIILAGWVESVTKGCFRTC